MPNPIEAFREQRAVAGEVYAMLKEVAALLSNMKKQCDGLVPLDELRDLLEQERAWLMEAQRTLSQVRELRANELRRLRTSVVARWAAAVAFALVSALAVGAGYAWVAKPYESELSELRGRQTFAEAIERRFVAMTPAERRQFDALMRWDAGPKPQK